MLCEFVSCNIMDGWWCECIHCERRLYGLIDEKNLNGIGIVCEPKPKEKENPKNANNQ